MYPNITTVVVRENLRFGFHLQYTYSI